MPSAENSVEVDISSPYKTELAGDKQLSLVITSQTTNNVSHYYYAKENGAANRRSWFTRKIYRQNDRRRGRHDGEWKRTHCELW